MRYGYFDAEKREYVITNPATPTWWVNYLGDPSYGAIISNNAAGYSFVKSGANGRITRFRFNSMMALPGRYIYLRDQEDGDYWTASWQPVGKPLAGSLPEAESAGEDSSGKYYKSECRHGTAYTVISAEYAGIASEVTYYVPLGKMYEVWHTRVTNRTDRRRSISLFGFTEFTNEDNYAQDQVNLQYSLYISQDHFEGNHIEQTISGNCRSARRRDRFFGISGAKADAYDGDLASFIGPYRTYSNPLAVERGRCFGSEQYNENACGVLESDLVLAPGETKELVYVLGPGKTEEAGRILALYGDEHALNGRAQKEVDELRRYWHGKLDHFRIETPSDEFNTMVNTWNAYQCFITFTWSRAASFIYCGERNGYGYRDTVQDIQGIIHLDPEMAVKMIRFMLSAQAKNGGGLPLVKFNHNAGHENTPDDPEYVKETGHASWRADDALWLFPTIRTYLDESGNGDFLDERIVYADGDEDTVYDHLKRAIAFSMNHMGPHHMPAGLHADWNDCLRLGAEGESVFVAFQLYYAIDMMRELAEERSDTDYISYLGEIRKPLAEALGRCWDEDRFIRGIRDNGDVVGAKKDPEASMWLNPQSWAVISGFADAEQAETALESVHRILNTPYGAKIMTPPYRDHYFADAAMHIFNDDSKENGAIFSQTQGWLILAESLMGHGDRAFEYFMETAPAAMNDRAEVRVMEPYVYGQFVEGSLSPYEGRSHVHWLTGTASTVMVGCVQGICGVRPDISGIRIDPAIPKTWDGFRMEKLFRGKTLRIRVDNSAHVEHGVKSVSVNGKVMDGAYIPAETLAEENDILVVMG